MKNFLKKTFFILPVMVVTATISHAAQHVERGYINSVTAKDVGTKCSLELRYSAIPDKGDVTQLFWSCDTLAGKNILDLAKTAVILNRKVQLTYDDAIKNAVIEIKLK
ncbi:hypothetical protein [Bartonella senegalensis]|uniref:hypothetical protein n=1 Tax=Bartonella senegalensis TaxID=1468418 RepID=UPI0002EA83B0|nr:hypothetical protein [Bartonella senegalensis]